MKAWRGCPTGWLGAIALGLAAEAAPGSVTVRLQDVGPPAPLISFGLPLAPGELPEVAGVRVYREGSREPLPDVRLRPLLYHADASGRRGILSLLVQAPRAALEGANALRVEWGGHGPGTSLAEVVPFASLRRESAEVVEVVDYSAEKHGNEYRLAESAPQRRVLFTGWEPPTVSLARAGYLTASGLFGELLEKSQVASDPRLRGLGFLSENLVLFAQGALYDEGYRPSAYPGTPGDPGAAVAVDLTQAYEAWLYDRCATFLLAYAHTGDVRFFRHGLRACSFYASNIDGRGYFTLKTGARGQASDPKYSHVRGLYYYYALTGDESALEAARRIARMWLTEPSFVQAYRQGRARGPDKLWSERLLGAALEALLYGYLLTREAELLAGARELFESAWGHLTAPTPDRLKAITGHAFAPQDCLVHAAVQHEGWPPGEPFCSPWMSALLVDPLLRYQALTRDRRVDQVFIRFARYLRDTATVYFYRNPLGDSFLRPSRCYVFIPGGPSRSLVPLYGAARRADGSRYASSEWGDFNHCADATTLTAAALRALKRTGGFDKPGPAPFRTEGESLVALHHELAQCALETFQYFSRTNRDPRRWKSRDLEEGYGKPDWTVANKIGFQSYATSPLRKLSWWFNGSLLQYRLLQEAGVSFEELRPGTLQPPTCP